MVIQSEKMTLLNQIDECMIKLERNFDECENHPEYKHRMVRLEEFFFNVLDTIIEINRTHRNIGQAQKVLAAIYFLYKELLAEGPWQCDELVKNAEELCEQFHHIYGMTITDLFKAEHDLDKQGIFNDCVHRIHLKLTANDFKKYPSVIQVYCTMFTTDIEEYQGVSPTIKMLPASLLLIDDYVYEHKKKGLTCCYNILSRLNGKVFEGGNFYEVIYVTLKKALLERDLEITKLSIKTFVEFMRLTRRHGDFFRSLMEELFDLVLDQIQTDSSLPRKAVLFGFTKTLIETLGVNCCNRQGFQAAVKDNLDISCHEGAEDIILIPVLEALEAWLRQCWCTWSLKSGQHALASLFRVLYACKREETADKIIQILVTIFVLSHQNEKDRIRECVKKVLDSLDTTNAVFKKRKKTLIKKYFSKTAQVQLIV